MRKSRLEAFTDGVMAIVITLLILDVKLPEVEYGGLAGGLIAILPKISVYALCVVLAFVAPVYSSVLLGTLALFLVFRSILQMGIGKCVI